LRLAFNSAVLRDSVRPPLRERASSLVLAVVFTLLMILGLLSLNNSARGPRFKGTPTTVFFTPEAETADVTPQRAVSKPQLAPKPSAPPLRPVLPPPPPPPVPMPVPYFIHLTPQEMASADITNIRHPELAGQGAQASASASAAGDSRPVGNAPNGEPLYNAEWYRRPTNAELDFYLPPHTTSDGWGMVACKTAAGHHVEDCVELGSSVGSHLSGAVRQAAWQFLVRAPRLGGKELIGAWVRIRIDYSFTVKESAEKPAEPAGPGD
jgi:protein TonB